ncbi:MAG: hypothetical protein ABIR71_07575 [Chthoniobacterales bacterium]
MNTVYLGGSPTIISAKSTDGGLTFTDHETGVHGEGGYSVIDQNAADTTNVTMYHTYSNQPNFMGFGRVLTTADAESGNWSRFGCGFGGFFTANGITCPAPVLFYAPLEQGPGNPNTLYFGSDVLYRSANSGVTMAKVSQEPIQTGVPISSIGISPQNDNVRLVGLRNGALFGTITGAVPLLNLDPGNTVPNVPVARTVIDPNSQTTAYVTLSAFGIPNVYRTTNLNAAPPTWTAISGSGANALPQIPINALLVDPSNSANLYAGTDIGVFASTDSGANWAPFGSGLPRVAVFDMLITPAQKLRIATHGRGLWELPLRPLNVITAVSRKIHGSAGTFDIDLPSTGAIGVECRSSGGAHTLVISFSNDVVSGNASLEEGIGSVSGSPTFSGNTMTVNLTGVADVQKVGVSLTGVTDSFAQVLPNTGVTIIFLVGDTVASRAVNSTDVGATKAQSGIAVSSANFRQDVTANGTINATDVGLVKSRSGQSVP